MRRILLSLVVLALSTVARAEPFEIKDGDRILFLGDTLLEREGTYGYLETRMVEQFPDRRFTVRNLAFSADTPLGWSRASFDPAAKGFERLKEQLALVKPTVVFLGYGMAASLQEMTDRSQDWTLNRDPARYGTEPMSAARFKRELAQCMDAIEDVAKGAGASGQESGKNGDPERGSDGAIEKGSARAPRAVPGAPPGTPGAATASQQDGPSTNDRKQTPGASGGAPDAAREARALPDARKSAGVRFVLLSPIQYDIGPHHSRKPGLPDGTALNKLIEQYTKVIAELAKERSATYVSLREPWIDGPTMPTDNGIHLTEVGYRVLADSVVAPALEWSKPAAPVIFDTKQSALRAAIIRKNELFFHRWRPANETYLFGFRKREQGKNAVEIPQFDPLIEQAEAEIDRLKKSPSAQPAPTPSAPKPAPFVSQPHPTFTLADGLEISLWAENPLLAKPTQANWDAQGRLWVASSAMYPMIAPGQAAFDKIIILEDPGHTGKATKSTVFADGLLIPTGVAPVLTPEGHWGCYVGQSTELLYFEDTDGDGKADKKRIVFSGFGTEDTHHIVHTLRWGPDGRLYFSQSVYIHTHMETPWGVVRLNSGGVFAYDPRTERVEVVAKGLWNTWGHAWDKWGQPFLTDGAGSTGLSWAFPGATFAPSEGARRTMPGISPGSYPKFAGLELIYSPHFPADWQGSAVTCDFRAHKIVHFKINDLGSNAETQRRGEEGNSTAPATAATPGAAIPPSSSASSLRLGVSALKSGYITDQLPVLVQTSDATFRPIDVKLGPDGAIYIADWSNPIINHGEVDFRDPRRDHEHGRIWRLSMKGGAAVKWESLVGKKMEELAEGVFSESAWAKDGSLSALQSQLSAALDKAKNPRGGWTVYPPLAGAADEKAKPKQPEPPLDPFMTAVRSVVKAHEADKTFPLMLLDLASGGSAFASEVTSKDTIQNFPKQLAGNDPLHDTYYYRVRSGTVSSLFQKCSEPRARTAWVHQIGESVPDLNVLGSAIGAAARPLFVEQIKSVVGDPFPRVRVEAMRALARISTFDSASLILDAAINAPKDDPYYEFAAWLSINDLAPQVAEWVEKNSADTAGAPNGEQRASGSAGVPPAGSRVPREPSNIEKPRQLDASSANERTNTAVGPGGTPGPAGGTPALAGAPDSRENPNTRDAKILIALESLPPDTTAPLIARLLAKRPVTRDGAGPWIELIGKGGGPAELQGLFERVAKGDLDQPALVRAINALADATRLRNLRPEGSLAPVATLIEDGHADTRAAAARLAGLWKISEATPRLEALATHADAGQRAAAFEGLRSLGGAPAVAALETLVRSENPFVPPAALAALAQLKPGAAIAEIPTVLGAIKSEPELLATWRGILQSKGATDLLEKNFPKDLPKPVLTTALRAARELGRKGDRLVAKLTPLAGETAVNFVPSDYLALAERAKKDGDPVAGEMLYRRAASACTTCHAIGGAGGKLGPDLTSIGASAPGDYIVESILNPAAKVKEGYHAFSFAMKDGTEAIGIPSRETPQEQFIRTLAGEQSLPKANIVSKKLAEGGASLMPAGLTAAWTDRERLNLYAFLGELGRPGPFDASKNNVARTWLLSDSGKVEGALKADAATAMPVYTLVDGRLTRDLLAEKLAMLAPKNAAVHLTTRFQAASAGKAKLNLTGIRKAWLDGQPLAIASEPSPGVDLTAGAHTFTVEVDTKSPPEVLRLESPAASFLGD